ncbi:hypothetical protein ACNQUF_11780 [Corynebacterium diphtheriae]
MGWDADPGEVSEKSDQKYFELLMKSRCLPAGYESRIPTMHARSFVYALDEIEKALEILEKIANMPESIAGIKQEWSAAFRRSVSVWLDHWSVDVFHQHPFSRNVVEFGH